MQAMLLEICDSAQAKSGKDEPHLTDADLQTVGAVIEGTLASAKDASATSGLLVQALDSQLIVPGLSEEEAKVFAVATQNLVDRAVHFVQKDYWVSLAVISSLVRSSNTDISSQARLLLSTYISRFPKERETIDPAQEHILPFIVSNIALADLDTKTNDTEKSRTLHSMGLAEQILHAGSSASVGDVVANFAQQRSTGAQSNSNGNPSTPNILSVEDVAKSMALIASHIHDGEKWSATDFAKGICSHCPNISWEDVVYRLPYANLNVQSEAGAVFIVETFLVATAGQNRPFPYSFMYEIWPDPHAQTAFLRCALRAQSIAEHLVDKHMPTLVLDPLDSLYQVYHSEFLRIVASPWNSLSLVLVLSHLLDSKASEDAKILLEYGVSQEPLLVTLALARLKVQHPRLHALLQHNIARFLKREFVNSSLFFELFRICEKKMMLAFFCNLQRKDSAYARQILGALIDLGILNEILLLPKHEDIMMLDFIVELAVLASRRGFISFESWFPGLLAELGGDILHASLEILHSKLQLESARQRGEDSGVTGFSSAELTIIFKSLGSVNMSPNNAANLKALYAQFLELASELERFENEFNADDSRIEKDAESLFFRLYRGELSVEKMVDTLENLYDSLQVYRRKTYTHVVRYPLEEFAFFENYPDKELAITGQLVGLLLQRHMLSAANEPTFLDMITRSFQGSPTTKLFRFGLTALQMCQTRIEQLPVFCAAIYQMPSFRQTIGSPVVQLVQSIIDSSIPKRNNKTGMGLSDRHHDDMNSGISGGHHGLGVISTDADDGLGPSSSAQVFRSVKPLPLVQIDEPYAEPSDDTKDKIQFAVNNLAQNNLEEKTSEVDNVLLPKHFVWFSQEIIVKRASQEPNYHALYLLFVDALKRPLLVKCILRETLVSITRLLNAESTINSSRDRGYLKNLGSWLGGITLARDQPILRENVSFKDLLREGYSENRLIVAIPFVCKLLEQAARSTIFHPPNPWLMSIMGVLSELYVTANLKLNLAFEIEVLCKALNLDVKEIQPSSILSSTPADTSISKLTMDLSRASVGGGATSNNANPSHALAQKGDGSGASLSSGSLQMLALSGADISVDVLGVLTQHASFQAAEQLFTQQPTMKRLFYMLTERMIREIIPIHVARSVYVAVSCTRDTIQKDFCGESNEENVHRAAQVMARGLAGALAVSLCREQLKSKLYLTMREFLIGHSIPEQSANSIAVGLVADNLDLACAIAEKESIERGSVQIDSVLSESYLARKRTRERTGQPFYDISRYNQLVYPPDFPDVLKVRLNGLQSGHLRVYEDYTQIPHFFSQISSGAQGLPGSTGAASGAEFGGGNTSDLGITPAELGNAAADEAGKFTTAQCFERFAAIIAELDKIVSNAAPGVSLSQLPSQHEACLFARDIIILAVRSANPDETAMDFAQALVNYLYRSESHLAIDLYVLLLARMCEMSIRVAKEVTNWLAFADDERKYNVPVTVALINEGLVSIEDQDTQLARLVDAGRPSAVDFAARLLRKVVIDKAAATGVRSFSNAIQALVKLSQNGRATPDVSQLLEDIQSSQQQQQEQEQKQEHSQQQQQQGQQAQQPVDKLEQQNTVVSAIGGPSPSQRSMSVSVAPEQEKRAQETASYQHILLNWARVYNHPAAGEAELTTLVRQLLQQVPLHDTNTAATFFRACVEAAIAFYEQSIRTDRANGHQMADALVKLVIYLVKLGGSENKTSLQPLRMFLSSVALEVSQTQMVTPELFSLRQRPYFRLLCNVLYEFNDAHRAKEPWCSSECVDEVISILGTTLDLLNPTFVPGFSFVWLMLVAHRYFFPRLMEKKERWPIAAMLLEHQIKFLEPFIADGQITESLKLLYRGMVCVILVILHDFPEFLADYALRLCDSIPASCVQLRNLLLSAYPREMRLPEPLTPNLKIDLLPEVSRSPAIPFDYAKALGPGYLKSDLESYLTSRKPENFASTALSQLSTQAAASETATPKDDAAATSLTERYDVAKINAFVLHIVVRITEMAENSARDEAQRDALELLKAMLVEADPEGRYLIVNAIANQLRFPSSHTYLCSRMILALFSKSDEDVRECIGRVLVERILVNRPFPWGLLVTLIEILRNPYYSFWSHEFTRRSPQIVEILSAVAKSIHPMETHAQQAGIVGGQSTAPQTSQPSA
ncbi:CCR4-NOT core subunit cdc39 [Coemansia sp. Benny D160-2]|nr:CCR4-NOT core subunit cdc39 [Coemansia sp. Benny D160-2]